MKVYGLTIVSSDGDIIAEDLNGKKSYRESTTILRSSRQEIINYAVDNVDHWFNIEDEFEDGCDDNGRELEEFKEELAKGEDICIQYSSFHVEFDFFSQDVEETKEVSA